MIQTETKMKVEVDVNSKRMVLTYAPRTERTLYDLCDLNGRVIRTGAIDSIETILDISDLRARGYVVLIVDGDQVMSQRVNFTA